MFDLHALRVLDTIDRRGSFARAAAELGRVPSAVTYLVRRLEDDLDVLLFDRRGHRATLTAAGRELLDEGRHLLRSADELERRVRRTGDGWEVEFRIALDTVVRIEPILELVGLFYREEPGTRVRLRHEVLSGTWEALLSGRADLAIGTFVPAPGEGSGVASGYRSRPLGELALVFAVAPDHPLAAAPEPLSPATVRKHRAVAVGDSARDVPPITVGLLGGQDVLTVPSMRDKIDAQVAGLGCGNVPLRDARPHVAAGRLIVKRLAESRAVGTLFYSWSTSARGRAMRWFLDRLEDAAFRATLIE